MRYSYVEPAREPPPWSTHRKPVAAPFSTIVKRSQPVDPRDPVVPADARRLVDAGANAHPSWRLVLTHSATLNEAGSALVHHVFLRVYGEGGEPLGHCGWSAGHTTGARVWNLHPERKIPFAFVGLDEFACWLKGIPYTPPSPVQRGTCNRCGATDVRVKNDGNPYKHKNPDMGMECT